MVMIMMIILFVFDSVMFKTFKTEHVLSMIKLIHVLYMHIIYMVNFFNHL